MMQQVLRSLVWLFLILFLGFGLTLIVANQIIRAQLKSAQPILVRDSVGPGSHTLSGVVPVQSTCDEITVNTEKTSNDSFMLVFNTWREPYVPTCVQGDVTREFHAVVFAPSFGVTFSAAVDGTPMPVAVIPEVPLKAPASTTRSVQGAQNVQ